MTQLCRSIRSSSTISCSAWTISVRRASAYFALISPISSLMICLILPTSARIPSSSLIRLWSLSSSSSIFSRSRPVSLPSVISTIACACTSDSPKRSIRVALESGMDLDDFMICTISSMLSSAIL